MSALPTPRGATIHARIAAQAALAPDAPAIVSDREEISYRELMARARAIARLLRRRGAGVEQTVGVCLERSTDLVVAMLGILEAGATYLPLDPKYPPDRVAFMLDDAAAKLLISRRELEPLFSGRESIAKLYLEELGAELATPATAEEEADESVERTFPEALSHLIYTSGSTGRPKGVSICHRNVTTFFDWAEKVFPDEELRGVFAATSVCFDLSVFEIFFPLTRGGTVIVGRDALHLPSHPARGRVTLVNTVPSAITELVRQKGLPPGVITVNLAGEPLKRALTDAVYAAGARKVYNLYGPSEDTTYSTWVLVPEDSAEEPTIGVAKDGSQAWVLGPRMEEIADGEIGELYMGGDGVSRGYLGRPQQTAERYLPDPYSGRPGARLYRTGDRVRRRPDGQIEFLGRFDHQVKIRGFRIELGEIEAALARHPAIEMPLALVREDVPGDKRIAAYFQLRAGSPAPDAAELRRHLADFLPHYMVPAAFVALAQMPLTPNGKIDRNPLIAMAPPAGDERDFEAPQGETEELLARLFAEALGVGPIGRGDSFLELGGHSLTAARLGARIEEELGLVCGQKTLFEAPTVAALAAALEGAPPVASAAIPPRDPAKAPLSSGMRGLLYLWQLDKDSAQYATPVLIRLSGGLDAEALRRSFERLIARHEGLRAYFPIGEKGFSEVAIEPPGPFRLPSTDLRGEAEAKGRAYAAAVEESKRGFDLGAEPSLRVHLWRLAEDEHYLLVNLHHVVTDGFSLQILFRELGELYAGEAAGAPAELPPLPAGLFDTLAHLDALVDRETDLHLPFWREQLRGARPVELAADRPRPRQPSHRGGAFSFEVPAPLVAALTAIGARHGASFFLVASAAFHAFVTRLTGQTDFVMGVPLAGRKHPATRGQLGLFINALPVRVDAAGDPTFAELLGRVRQRHLAAWEHELMPMDRLVAELAPDRQLGRNPFFDLAFQVRDGYFDPDVLPGLAAEHLLTHNGTSKFDVEVALVRRGETLKAEVEYDLEIFDRATVDLLMESFMTLLGEVAARPESRLSDLELMPQSQREQLAAWNATGGEAPLGSSLAELFRAAACRDPEAPALEYGETRVSYAELDRQSDVLAARLREAGVGPGDFVAVALERSPRQIAALVAIVKSGAAYVPLDAAYPRERLAFLLEDSGARLLITEEALAHLLPIASYQASGGRLLLLGASSLEGREEPLPAIADAGFPAYLIYTSGSTGTPKGVVTPQRGVIRLVFDNRFLELGPEQRIAQASNVSFDAATFEIWGALLHGGCLVGLDKETLLSPEKLRAFLEQKRISSMWLTASLFHQYARQVPELVQSLGTLLFGGERCDPAAVRQALERGPKRLINGYGPTETTTFAACYEVHEVPPGAVSVPIGRPIGETELLVVDRWGRLLPIGAAGELWIGGAGVAHGYHRRPGLTAAAFVPHPEPARAGERVYRSGDLVRLRPDGQHDYRGRLDQQVKVRGFRVELGEIETLLGGHPAVAANAVALQDDGRGSGRLVAYVALRPAADAGAETLRAFLGQTLPDHLVPTAFQFLDQLPLTPNGKVDRRALPAFDFDKAGAAPAGRRPQSEIEKRVHATWCELFQVEEIGLEAPFFSIGGHSLLAAQLLARLNQQFRLQLPLRVIYEQPTIEKLAQLIETQLLEKLLPAAAPAAPVPVEPAPETAAPEPPAPEPAAPEPAPAAEGSLWAAAMAVEPSAPLFTPPAPPAPVGGLDEEIEPLPPGAPMPLSFGQKRLYFLHLLEPDAGTYNMGFAFELRGALDRPALERALTELARRHAVLRTRYSIGTEGPAIAIDEPAGFRFADEDLRQLPPEARGERLQQEVDAELRRPFDLERGPVWRARLLRLEEEAHGFIFSIHHIATDGWSQGVLSEELAELYDAYRHGRPSPLVEPQLQYQDFAAWQQRQLDPRASGRMLEFWRERLAGMEPTELAPDFSRPAELSHRGAIHALSWPDELMPRVKAFSRQRGTSPFVTCLTAFYATLQAYCDKDDLAVGTMVGGRSQPELESIVGFFVNTLIVRSRLDGDPTFEAAVAATRKSFLQAFEHGDLPFDHVVESLLPTRDLSRHPFVSILFQVFDRDLTPSMPGLESREIEPSIDTAKIDLTVSVLRHSSGSYAISCEYALDLYRPETIENFFRSYLTVLQAGLAAPERRLSELPLLDPEQQELWRRINATATAAPVGRGLYELFREQAEAGPHRVAVVHGERSLSYGELAEAAGRLAGRLAENGVRPGDVVGLCLERSIELTTAIVASLRLGATYAPIDPTYPAERLAFMFEDSGTPLVVTRQGLADALPLEAFAGRGGKVLLVDREGALDGPAGPEAADPALPAILIYTSGSTGRPKGVIVPQAGLVRLVRENLYLDIGPDDSFTHLANPSFDLSSFEIWGALLNGARMVVIDTDTLLHAESFRQVLAAQRPSLILFTTSLFHLFVQQSTGLFEGVRVVLFCGERCDPETVRHALATSGAGLLQNAYGPTEVVTFATVEQVVAVPERAAAVPIGPPIAHTTAYVIDRRGRLLPPGAMGELLLGGAAVAHSYHGRPQLTARAFVPDPFGGGRGERLYRTGDLARLLPGGGLDYLGRIDQQIKLRGFRIELGEIESALAAHPDVAAAGALVQADERGEKHLVAYFAAARQPAPAAAELRAFLAESLPAYSLPGFFIELDALPVTASGKLDRKVLAARPLAVAAGPAEKVAPRDPLEQAVHRMWCELLGTGEAGVHDNFFMSGGHSLLAAQLLARFREQLGVALRLQTFFRNPTIAGLAIALADGAASRTESGPQLEAGSPPMVSFGQRRLFFLYQLDPESPAYNMPLPLELEGELDTGALRRALETVIHRHEVLRTRYLASPEGPLPVIDPPAPLALPVKDLSALPEAAREAALLAHLENDALRPFRLEAEPAWRGSLLKLGERRHVLLLTTHHIASDAWSQQLIAGELSLLYAAYRQGGESPLPPLAFQYADYANWLARSLEGPQYAARVAYWRERLADLPALELPADFRRPESASGRGGLLELRFSAAIADRLRAFARERGDTVFNVLLAAFSATLAGFTGQHSFALGTVVGGRPRTELESLVGFFVNTMVLRQDLEGGPSFAELLRRCRDSFLEAEANDLPFDKLVEELQPERDGGRNPFVQVLFQLVGTNAVPAFDDLAVQVVDHRGATAKFDLTMIAQDFGEGELLMVAEYATDLYRPATIESLFRSLQVLLDAAMAEPERRVDRLPLLDEGQQELWRQVNLTATGSPLGSGLYPLFAERARRHPERTAVVDGDRRVSYGELAAMARDIAAGLRAGGVGPGDVVGLCLERSAELAASFVAVLAVGATYAPLDPLYPPERLAFMIEDTGMPLLLTRAALAGGLPTAGLLARGGKVLAIEDIPTGDGETGATAAAAAVPAMLIYTSGSTGRPKAVVVPQDGVIRLVLDNRFLAIGEDEVFGNVSNPSFDAITFEVWGALLNGGRIAVVDGDTLLSPERFRQAIAGQGITVMFLTVALFQQFLRHGDFFFAGMRALFFGGERADAETVRRALERSGAAALYNGYGPTEDTTFAVVSRVEEVADGATSVPIGRLIAFTEGYVVDPDGRLLPPGALGELLLGGAGLADGYFRRPALTARSFVPHPFGGASPGQRLYRTGDLARLLPDGQLEYAGRIDDQVKVRGFRIELGEIESALALHPGVGPAGAVVGRDSRGDAQLAVYFVPASAGEPAPEPAELRAFLAESLPAYLVPSFFVPVEALPLSPNGKLDRKKLAARPLEAALGGERIAPRGPLEEAVHRLWCEVLKTADAGVQDNFFSAGGHSLLASQLLARMRDQFGIELSLRSFFRNPTIEGLAIALADGASGRTESGPALTAGSPRVASFGQRRLFLVYQLDPESPAYNMPLPLELEGELDTGALAHALETVIHRHEVLRTRYLASPEGPLLAVDPPAPLALPLEDLSGLPEAERENALLDHLERDALRPFRLEAEPVWRSSLLKLGERRHVLLLTTHHIASDGWSQQLIAGELSQLYAAYRRGGGNPLPPLQFQYADYAHWLAKSLEGPQYSARVAYWRERLADLPALELPADFRRPESASGRGGLLELRFSEEIADRLRAFARERGETVFNVLLAAFSATLAGFTGQRSFALGTVVGGRPRTELESLVGFFVNTLVLRQDLAGGPSFAELLRRCRESFLEAEANDLPFDKLVEELQPERDGGRNPFVQILFQLVGTNSVPVFDDLSVQLIDRHGGTAKFDLTVVAQDFGEGELLMVAEYASDLYRPATIDSFFRSLQVLLGAAMAEPERRRVDQLPLLDEGQRELWRRINRSATGSPLGAGLYPLFAERARRHPERTAVIDGERRISYGQLAAMARDIAAGLRAGGVEPGDVVGLCLERSAELAASFVAVLAVGATYAPLDPLYPPERLAFMIEDTGMPLLLTRAALAGGLPTAGLLARGGRVLAIEELAGDAPSGEPAELPAAAAAAVPAMLIYTSGSTGRPKAVVVPQDGVIRLVLDNRFFEIGEDDVFGNVSNPSFDAITFEVWGALLNGGRMAVVDGDTLLSPERFRQAIAGQGITVMFLTVALFQQYLRHGDYFFAGLRALFFGGERSDNEAVRRAVEKSGVDVLYHAYGPTEDTTFALVGRVDEVPEGITSLPIGDQIAFTESYVVDPDGRLLPPGALGELLLGGAGLADGYFRRPALTARSFVPHPFGGAAPGQRLYRTGDLARLLPDGQVEYVSRIDDQVKVRGFRIELGEIESAVAQHPGVLAAGAVVGRDSRGDAQLAAYYVPAASSAGDPAPEPAELRAFLAESLPGYLMPSFFVPIEALPLSPNGKLDRKKLAARPLEAALAGERIAPQGPLEEAVHALWCDLLKIGEAGAEDNFFSAGGHSLLASQLLARVRDRFGVEVSLRSFFQRPTIAGLAARLATDAPVAEGDQPSLSPGGPLLPSFGQRRLYFLHQLDPDSPAYNIPLPIELEGELDVAALERAIGSLIGRHEVLRTRYLDGEDGLRLELDPPSPFALPVKSLEQVPAERREEAAMALVDEEMRRPFRLEKDPMLRAALLRLGERRHLLLLTTHHIASDGWSQQLLAEEMAALYAAYRRGEENPLPPLRLQYSDYANWLDAMLQGERYDRLIGFWRDRLADLPALELPTDFPYPEMPTQQGAIFELRLPAELSERARAATRERGETLFVLLLAAFAGTLARYSGQRDFGIGTVIAGRPRTELESMVGFFVNTLVLRQSFAGEPSFEEALRRTREGFLDAQAHQEVPFEKLAFELRPERDTARAPFVQVLFQVAGVDLLPRLEGLETRLVDRHGGTSKFDLSVGVTDLGAGESLHFSVEYNTDVLLPASVERLFASFATLLEAALADPRRNLWRLPLVAPADLALLASWEKHLPYDAGQTIPGLLARQMAATPERVALVHEYQEISYGQLAERVARLAHLLRRHGVGPETIVGVCLERTPELVVALQAVLFAGGTYLPLDPAYPESRIEGMLEDTRARLLITQESLAPRFSDRREPNRRLLVIERLGAQLAAEPAELPAPAPGMDPEQIAYLIYTSGSTGRPKGVAITHHNAVAFFAWAATEFSPELLSGVSATISVCFDVSIFELFFPLTQGGTVILAANVLHLTSLPARERIKILTTVPSAFAELLRLDGIPSSVRAIGLPGEPLKLALVQQIFAASNAEIAYNLYGPSEDTTYSTFARLYRGDTEEPPVGWPIANSRGYVVDAQGELLPPGVMGELYLGGDGVSRGYLNRPRLTAERYLPDPFSGQPGARLYRTGDRIRWRADGQLLCFGRFDHQVKLRGFRIELGEIEAVLARHPAVGQTVAMVREDVPGDPRLVAYYTLRESGAKPAQNELREHLRQHLPHFMVPSFLIELPAMPLNPNGKTDRAKLPPPQAGAAPAKPAAGKAASPADLAALLPAQDDYEEFLAEQWRAVLHLEEVGHDDNFFDLGGHSLLMPQLLKKIEGRFPRMRLLDLFRFPTITKLADHLRGGPRQAAEAALPVSAPQFGAAPRDVAIVGVAGRFPQAADVETMWRNVLAGAEMIGPLADEEMLAGGVDAESLALPEYVKRGAVLDGIEDFDADFFAMNAREAQITDPQHRLFLETAWEALERAGWAGEGQDLGSGGRVGVFAGVSQSGYFLHHVLAHPELLAELGNLPAHLGSDKDFLPTRVAYKLDLTGPAFAVQTACSTSLVAVHLACRSLADGDCDMALAGGATVQIPHKTGYPYVSDSIMSPDGHCRAFDAAAAGTVPSSGIGVVVLKRLADAVAAGDSIVAVIRGSAINNDGASKVGFTAPSVDGQARVIADALQRAGVPARSVGYVETHGTGTQLGDPIEVAALEKVHRAESADRGYCAISSFKTQVGHMDSAAGVGGLIRAALAVERATIPPNLHFERPNPELRLDESPFYVPQTATKWPAGGKRRAGVSSFGIGGTNAHLVLEEAPPALATTAGRPRQLLLLSARSAASLDALSEKLAAHLESQPALGGPERLADVASTLHRGRRHFAHRRAIVARDGGEAIAQLRDAKAGAGGQAGNQAGELPPIAFLFPGQGSQYAGMGRELYQHEPVFRREIDACAEKLEPLLGLDLRPLLFAGGEERAAAQEKLQSTALAQPALFAVEWALASLWLSWGIVPSELIGHSIGEYVAATLAGVFERDAALELVAIRGRLMQELPAGAMLAVRLPESAVYGKLIASGLAEQLAIAAINGPGDVVVSGPREAIAAFAAALEKAGSETRELKTSHAFHSPMMGPILDAFRQEVARANPQKPRRSFLSNLTGAPIDAELAVSPDYWARHLRHSVRFADGIGHVLANPKQILLEVGPGRALGTLARRVAGPDRVILASLPHPQDERGEYEILLETVARLYARGAKIAGEAFYAGQQRRRLPLPTTPFERRRFWLEARPPQPFAAAPAAAPPLAPVEAPPVEALPAPVGATEVEAPADEVAPDEVAVRIEELWRTLLGAEEKIPFDLDFYEAGGDSLMATQLANRLRKVFEVTIRGNELMADALTIADQAALVRSRQPGR